MHICYGLIKILTFSSWSIYVIFACHHLKIMPECLFRFFENLSINWIWIYRLSSFPIILNPSFEKIMFSYSIAWSFIDVSEVVLILRCTCSFIKKFFVLSMIESVIFRISHMSSIVPWRHSSTSRLLNAFLKSIHFILFQIKIFNIFNIAKI